MKRFLLFFYVLFACALQAQEDVAWSKMELKKGHLINIVPVDSNLFYALRWTGGEMLGHYQISKHEHFEMVASARVRLQVYNQIANFESFKVIGGKPYLFLSDKTNGKNNVYLVEVASDLSSVGEPLLVASYDLDRSHKQGWFEIIQSRNQKFFSVVWELPGRSGNRDVYGFKIYNDKIEVVNDGEYPVPIDPELSIIHSHHISNAGDYFLALTEFDEGEKKSYIKNRLRYKALHIYHIAQDGLTDYVLEIDGRRVDAMAMTSDSSGMFTITGLFGKMEKRGVQGVFFQRVDLSAGTLIDEGFKDFPEEFIRQDWSEKDWKKQQKREERGVSEEPQLFNYDMREAVVLEDGSVIGTMEQYYVQIRSYADMQSGQSSSTYYYYYNDIIVYRIDKNGDFQWIQKIPKFQVSSNDAGFYSSYESYLEEGKIHFIFNDDTRNYDTLGRYAIKGSDVYAASYGRKNNTVALVSMDLETGDQIRRSFFDRDEIMALAVPKLFAVDDVHRQMFIYALWGRKEKFGRIELK